MSVEIFILVNFSIDFAVIAAISRSCGTFGLCRACTAALLCALYGVAAALRPRPLSGVAYQLTVLAVASWIAVGRFDALRWALTAALMSLGMAVAGGAAFLLTPHPVSAWQAVPAALAGVTTLTLLFGYRHPLRDGWQVEVQLNVDGRTARFPALIDTGNRLREPLSGQPVLIAEARLLREVLPVRASRSVAFGALGGEGTLPCFRPSMIWLIRGRRRVPAPPAWIAVVPGRLPGSAAALAPCEFAATRV